MPFAYSPEFRSMVVEQMRDGRSVAGLARELEMHESTLHRWKRQDRVDRGLVSGVGTAESARLREARRRIRELEAELAAAKRARRTSQQGAVLTASAQRVCYGQSMSGFCHSGALSATSSR